MREMVRATVKTIQTSREHRRTVSQPRYLALDALIPEEEIEQLRDIYDRLFGEKTGWDKCDQFDLAGRKARRPPNSRPAATLRLRETPRAQRPGHCPTLLGPEMMESTAAHDLRPQGLGRHALAQDQAYHDPTMCQRGVNFWLPLDDQRESACYISCLDRTN